MSYLFSVKTLTGVGLSMTEELAYVWHTRGRALLSVAIFEWLILIVINGICEMEYAFE